MSECEACPKEVGDVRISLGSYHEPFEDALPKHHALLAAKDAEIERLRAAFVNLLNACELQLVHLGSESPDFLENLRIARRALTESSTERREK